MKASICAALALITAYGAGWSQEPAPEAPWKEFSVPGFIKFDYPSHYQLTDESGKGELKWSFELVGAENEPGIHTTGFHFFSPRYDLKRGETSKQYVKRVPFPWKPGAKVKTEELMNGKVVRATTTSGELTDAVYWYLPGPTAGGTAVKRLVIENYRARDKAVVERIVKSWLGGVKFWHTQVLSGEPRDLGLNHK